MRRFYNTMQPILDILDEGLLLYRRGFVVFVLLAAIWIVPVAILSGLFVAFNQIWGIIGTMLLGFVLAVYLIGSLSRATMALQQNQTHILRASLAISPVKLAGMGCYALIFSVIANVLAAGLLVTLFSIVMGGGVAFIAMMTIMGNAGGLNEVAWFILFIVMALVWIVVYMLSLVVSGATYSSLVYSLQPFVQHEGGFSDAVQSSVHMIFYRFPFNMLAFLFASAIFGATAFSVTTAIGVLLPLPLLLLVGDESPVAVGLSAFAWFIGLIVVLPPMPIWMSLLYQRNYQRHQGGDLATRITTLMREEPLT